MENKRNKSIAAYIDGSYTKDKTYSGYAVVFVKNNCILESISGCSYQNIKMQNVTAELTAAMKAVEWAVNRRYSNIIIYHDFIGISKIVTGEWGVKTPFTRFYKKFMENKTNKINISFEFIKSHSGDIYNDMADKLARACGSAI